MRWRCGRVGEQAVGDVGHRLRAGLGRDKTLTVWRLRHQMTARTSSNSRMPLCHNAYPVAERPRSPAAATADPGRAPLRNTGLRPPRSPSAVTDHPLRAGDQVAADDPRAGLAGLQPHSVGQRCPQLHRGVLRARRRRPRTPCCSRPSPRRRRRSARSPCARHPAARTSQTEVPALDEHVGGHGQPARRVWRPPQRPRGRPGWPADDDPPPDGRSSGNSRVGAAWASGRRTPPHPFRIAPARGRGPCNLRYVLVPADAAPASPVPAVHRRRSGHTEDVSVGGAAPLPDRDEETGG